MKDEVTGHKAGYVGDVARLEIPLKSVMNLRRVAEELRGLAMALECLSRFSDEEPAVTMLEVRAAVKRCSDRLTAIRSRGRLKRSRNKF